MLLPVLQRSHRASPPCARRFLMLVVVSVAAVQAATAGSTSFEHSNATASTLTVVDEAVAVKRLRSQSMEKKAPSLQDILEEMKGIKARIRLLQEEKEISEQQHLPDGVYDDPESRRNRRRTATTTVTLAQFNQFKTAVNGQLAAITTRIGVVEAANANLKRDMANVKKQVAATSTELASAEDRIDAATQSLDDLTTRLSCVDPASGAADLIFEGCNVHVRNGAGQTASANAQGNLIVGYNEQSTGWDDRTGSHMIVVGPYHSWKGYGGVVVGSAHRQESAHASIICGSLNVASGEGSVVLGGQANQADGQGSVAAAGTFNMVIGVNAMAAAGSFNSVQGSLGLAGGGSENSVGSMGQNAPDSASVVIGGSNNVVNYSGNVVIGGFYNAVPALSSTTQNVVQVGGLSNMGPSLDDYDVGVASTRFAD